MASSNSGFHEPPELLPEEVKNHHRALVTIIEELEAVDWYEQRAAACSDPELKAIILHHRKEEIEHALMTLEWLRRRDPVFAEEAKTYLFTTGSITHVETAATKEGGGGEGTSESVESRAKDASSSSLGIGNLKRS